MIAVSNVRITKITRSTKFELNWTNCNDGKVEAKNIALTIKCGK